MSPIGYRHFTEMPKPRNQMPPDPDSISKSGHDSILRWKCWGWCRLSDIINTKKRLLSLQSIGQTKAKFAVQWQVYDKWWFPHGGVALWCLSVPVKVGCLVRVILGENQAQQVVWLGSGVGGEVVVVTRVVTVRFQSAVPNWQKRVLFTIFFSCLASCFVNCIFPTTYVISFARNCRRGGGFFTFLTFN